MFECTMTMTYCRTCCQDVHITHKEDECTGEPDLRVPDELRRAPRQEPDRPAEDEPDVY